MTLLRRVYANKVLVATILGCLIGPGCPASQAEPSPFEKCISCTPAAATTSEGYLLIPSYAFDRGNAKTFTTSWADAAPMIAFGGQTPAWVEYDVEFPVAGPYALSIYYAAHNARPMELLIDGKKASQCCRAAFGTWNTSGAKWEEATRQKFTKGKHTIRLQATRAMPHIVALRFDSELPFPKGWVLNRPTARTLNSPPAEVAEPYKPTDVDVAALRRAIEDLTATFGARYARGREFLDRLAQLAPVDEQGKPKTEPKDLAKEVKERLLALQREALLANPLLDFDTLLLVKRGAKGPALGLPRNWQSNSSLPKTGYDDQIATLKWRDPEAKPQTLFKPDQGRFVGDVDLHFDADRMLFSMVDDSLNRWQVFEIGADGKRLRQITGAQPDVDSYDACYLPDDRILFTSTACFVGVPCVYGSSHVAVLYSMTADGKNIRQLCFDQEHNWCPTVLNNGRILYARWEYADTPHSNTRLLFHMNPDGTGQMEYLGSNSYWPNAFFYARPIPGHPTKVVSVIGGHHDNPRMGELVLFDPARGRWEETGAIQHIPGYGKRVERVVRDGLTSSSWPKFLHPYPLSDKHFLVACKPTQKSLWGIYLVDTFDNFVLIKELPEYALLEPLPLRKTPRPPVLPEKIDPQRRDAVVYISDIYAGNGLKGIPRGTVKKLRLFTYHYAYQGMGGLLGVVGADGPWDIRRVIGTVPVHADGSAKFRIPANVPVAMQPLDEEEKAIQQMRSWMTGMPGEVVQCAGCHEKQNTAPPPVGTTVAASRQPDEITPWYGPTRGFSYAREVQPVIDRHCVACHNGKDASEGSAVPNLRGDERITDWKSVTPGNGGKHAGKFSVGYYEMTRFVRRGGIESPYGLLTPMEFHADTTELVQLLKHGHHGVQLDAESWNRLITWIDMNCPFHGTWSEELDTPGVQRDRRRELLKLYANVDDDPEAVPQTSAKPVEPVLPAKVAEPASVAVSCPNWPFDAAEAKRRQDAAGLPVTKRVELDAGLALDLVLIPAGEFVMGSTLGQLDERPQARLRVAEPFWMSRLEITNQVYAQFDARHSSGVEDKNAYQFGIIGYPADQPDQPVVRVSCNDAMTFCRWLSKRAGMTFTLPSESQWEWAARAGTATPFWYGGLDSDFSRCANLADAKLIEFASNPYTIDTPLASPTKYDAWIPKDTRFNDGALIAVTPGKYRANPWGLCDVHGNVAEWTRSRYRAYPYRADDGREQPSADSRMTVRGGSWRDRPAYATSSYRLSYPAYQQVYNVGFRVICTPDTAKVANK